MNWSNLENFTVWDVPRILAGLACYITGIIVVVVIIWIMYSGFKFLTSLGDPAAYSEAKKNFYWSLVGMVLIFGVYTIIVTVATFLGYSGLPILPFKC